MLLPTKYIPLPDTYLGVGAIILKKLAVPRTVTELWRSVRSEAAVSNPDRFYLVLDFLYTFKLIELHNGLIRRRSQS